ncbi:MAG: dephospho-CoA kinase [Planctomycetota bacterium]
MNPAQMLVIGVMGGIASGKSFVCQEFEKLGARCLRADEVGHQVLQDSTVQSRLRARWGAAVFDVDGQIDRAAVARIVFAQTTSGEAERRFLEQVTHPRIQQQLLAQLDEWRQQGDVPVVLLDAALLLEAGWDRWCDALVFIDSTWEQRVARVARRGWTAADLQAREAAQWPLEVKRSRATYQLDNSGTPAATSARVQELWQAFASRFC